MNINELKKHTGIARVAECLADTSASVYVVGGAIRDAFLDFPTDDVDIVIGGMPLLEVEKRLAGLGPVDVIGKRFAVIRVTLPDRTHIDISLPRTDASFGTGRYRDVEVRADPDLPIEQDLARRDFTMNAMAWNIATKELIDPFHGSRDLSRRIIRAVGDPAERFQEDATRMLRAARFSATLGFSIEEATADAVREKLPLLLDEFVTPREVIAQELMAGFSEAPVAMLDTLDQLGIATTLIPELTAMKGCQQPEEFHAEGDVWTHTRLALEALADRSFKETFDGKPSPELIVATLLHDIGKPPTLRMPDTTGIGRIRFDGHAPEGARITRDICSKLKLTSTGVVDCARLVWLIEHHLDVLNLDTMRPATVERIFLAGDGLGQELQQLTWADSRASLDPKEATRGDRFHLTRRFGVLQTRLQEILSRGYRGSTPVPLVDGTDVMDALALPPGPVIRELLDAVRDAQLNGRIADKESALKFIKEYHAAHH